jgi:hypothetical protein
LAVIPDLMDSVDLSTMTDAELDGALGFTPVHVTAGSSDVTREDRTRREWTSLLLIALFALVVGEMLLAWWCGRGV